MFGRLQMMWAQNEIKKARMRKQIKTFYQFL